MRTARVEVLHVRHSDPLLECGRTEKTFQGLGIFVAAVLLLCGSYLLVKAFLEPLEATEMTVLGAGFFLALATFGVTYLFWPRSRSAILHREHFSQGQEDGSASLPTPDEESLKPRVDAQRLLSEQKDLPGPM